MASFSEKIALLKNFRRKKDKANKGGVFDWLYKKFSSIRTSVYILGGLSLFYIVGTVFPQGEDIEEYIKAGGKAVTLVRVFGLLDFFASPLFLIAAALLFLNLLVCVYDRYSPLFKKTFPKNFEPTDTFYLTHGRIEAEEELKKIFTKDLGFKKVSDGGDWVVLEKGLPYKVLTWLYHLGILVCFGGFLLTYLFAYEDSITLKPKTAETLIPESGGRLMGIFRDGGPVSDFEIILEEFKTEYTESPSLDFPKDKLTRLAVGLGWKAPEYKIDDESFFPKDWKSTLRIVKGKNTVKEKTIELNDPLRYAGYTFYQMDFEQTIKIRVDNNPILLEGKTGEDIIIPGLDDALKFGILRTGTITRLDGTVEEITPFAMLNRHAKESAKPYEEIGKIELGDTVEVDGRRITFANYEEASILSYRYDPGVSMLWYGGIFVLITMCLRFFGGWYMAAYRVGETDGIVYVSTSIQSKGLLADERKLAGRLQYYLTKDDLTIEPLPPVE